MLTHSRLQGKTDSKPLSTALSWVSRTGVYKVLVTVGISVRYQSMIMIILDSYEIVPNPYKGKMPNEAELCAVVGGIDAILIGNDGMNERVLSHADQLKVIAKSGIGVDNIDLVAASRRGIAVTNVPGTTANSVADLTFGLMLESANSSCTPTAVAGGMWPVDRGNDIYVDLGIIGFGRIGQAVAKRARGFDMRVLAYDEVPNPRQPKTWDSVTTLDELVPQCDYITLHVPKTPSTTKMFDAVRIARMKKGPSSIQPEAGSSMRMHCRCCSGHWPGCGRRIEWSPLRASRLFDCENFLITSHSGGNSKESII